jgi:hypothetical protein
LLEAPDKLALLVVLEGILEVQPSFLLLVHAEAGISEFVMDLGCQRGRRVEKRALDEADRLEGVLQALVKLLYRSN